MTSIPTTKAQTLLLLMSDQSITSFRLDAKGAPIEYLRKLSMSFDTELIAETALSSYGGELYHLAIIPKEKIIYNEVCKLSK